MRFAGAVALFAAYVPFRDLLGLDVVVDRVATVAEGSGGARGIATGVVDGPPVGVGGDLIGAPDLVFDVPLCAERKVVVADFLEVTLLPLAAVGEGDVFLFEGDQGVGCGEVREDGFGMEFGVEDDVCHSGFGPAAVDFRVAGLAGLGSDEAVLGGK